MDYAAGFFVGEKTLCWICDLDGKIVAKGESFQARLRRDGAEAVKGSLSSAFSSAAGAIGIKSVKVAVCCLPDIDTPIDELSAHEIVRSLSIAEDVAVYNRFVAVFFGAIAPVGEKAQGAVVIGDLGAVGFGLNSEGEMFRTGGWEYFLGDEGSAYWIAKRALRACIRSFDGRDEKTALEEAVVKHYALQDARGLVDLFNAGKLGHNAIVPVFDVVVEGSKNGDKIAKKIMEDAADELVRYSKAIVEKLDLGSRRFELSFYGVVFEAFRDLGLLSLFEERLKSFAPDVQIIKPRYEPIYGAIALALEKATGKFIIPSDNY